MRMTGAGWNDGGCCWTVTFPDDANGRIDGCNSMGNDDDVSRNPVSGEDYLSSSMLGAATGPPSPGASQWNDDRASATTTVRQRRSRRGIRSRHPNNAHAIPDDNRALHQTSTVHPSMHLRNNTDNATSAQKMMG